MSVGFLAFRVTWGSQGCKDLRGHQGQWAPREIQVSREPLDLKECEVLLVCLVFQETLDYRASMEMMAHLVHQVSQDATGLKEIEAGTAPLVSTDFKDLRASQEYQG